MLLASQQDPQDAHPFEIGKFIINDIGPFVPASGLARLTGYVGKDVKFRYDLLRGLLRDNPQEGNSRPYYEGPTKKW